MSDIKKDYSLVITIVEKGNAEEVIEYSKMGGAEGGTIIPGRGLGANDTSKILGMLIEPEKEVVLILIPKEKASSVLTAITEGMNLEKPGRGISFVLDVPFVAGIFEDE